VAVNASPNVTSVADAALDAGGVQDLVGYHARRTALCLIDGFMRAMAPYELRPVEFSVLSVVVHNPGATSSQLSHTLNLLPPNVVRLVQRLERRELLSRRRDVQDRRAIGLYATPKGAALLKQAHTAAQQSEVQSLAHLSAAEQAILRGLLRKVYH